MNSEDRSAIEPANMKENELISVIVPVYNVEAYLNECVDSLLRQDYNNYEVVLVDDGSTDRSGEICDLYAEKDHRIRVIHKPNGGLSDARNHGVNVAKGEFVVFVDSDDCVSNDCISHLTKVCRENNVLIAGAGREFGENADSAFRFRNEEVCVLNTEEALSNCMYRDGMGVSACGKIYPKSILMEFPYPIGKYYEDLGTTYKIISSFEQMGCSKRTVYFYRTRRNSITKRTISEAHLCGLEFAKEEYTFVKENHPGALSAAKYRIVLKIVEYMDGLRGGSNEERRIFSLLRKELRPLYLTVCKDDKADIQTKIKAFFIMVGYKPMCLFWKVLELRKQI